MTRHTPRPSALGPRPSAFARAGRAVLAVALIAVGTVSVSAMAIDWDQDDNGCPDPDQMSLLLDQGTLLGLEWIEIPTSQRTPELDGVNCNSTPWCESSFAYLPPPIDVPGTTYPRDELLLWLVGGGNQTSQMHMIPQTAAYAGYRTINLSWDNNGSPNFENRCDLGLDGECSSQCVFDVVMEYLTGFDVAPVTLPDGTLDHDDSYDPHPMRSIEGKLKLAIEHMHVRDSNLNQVPLEGWDDFCTPTELKWEKIEVAGFSMGAQLASYISYVEPGSNPGSSSIGFLGVDLGVPACEYANVGGNGDATDAHYPELLDDHSTLPPCGETSACPSDNRFIALHDDGLFYDTSISTWAGGNNLMDLVDQGFSQVGISHPPVSVDAAIQGGTLLDTGGRIDQTSFGNLLETSFVTLPGNGGHGSMAEDGKLVREFDAYPSAQSNASTADEYCLMPLYLQAFCELSE